MRGAGRGGGGGGQYSSQEETLGLVNARMLRRLLVQVCRTCHIWYWLLEP